MAMTELDTFICNFHQLWQCGQTAHLDLDTHAGTAWVGLRVQLGHHPPAPLYHHPGYHHPQHVPRASLSRERRRKRRAAAAAQRNDVNAFSVTATEIVVDALNKKLHKVHKKKYVLLKKLILKRPKLSTKKMMK